jgi:hypothetical protein
MSKKQAPGDMSLPLVEATLAVMTELAQVLGEEIKLIKKNDVAAVRELLRRKSKLVIKYQSNMKSIAANPDLVKQAPADMRAILRTTGVRLAEVTERNATVLGGAVTGTQRLIHHIIRVVKEEALPKKGYSDPRTARMELGTYSPTCLPVAVNRTA